MALKTFKPITPGLRQLVIVDRSELYKGKPVKALTEGKSSSGGRNNLGRITVRFRGGGHKRTCAMSTSSVADAGRCRPKVERIEYDPNRTAFIALIRLPGRRACLHPGSAASCCRRSGVGGRAGRHQAGQRDADRQHAGGHDHPQRRAEDRPGRRYRPLCRHLRSDRWSRPGLRHGSPEFGRAASGPWQLLRAPSARCPTPTT